MRRVWKSEFGMKEEEQDATGGSIEFYDLAKSTTWKGQPLPMETTPSTRGSTKRPGRKVETDRTKENAANTRPYPNHTPGKWTQDIPTNRSQRRIVKSGMVPACLVLPQASLAAPRREPCHTSLMRFPRSSISLNGSDKSL